MPRVHGESSMEANGPVAKPTAELEVHDLAELVHSEAPQELGRSLQDLPEEILRNILLYIPPEENLGTIQVLSRHMSEVANEDLLWRYHCITSFKYWAPHHQLQKKLAGRAFLVDWKELWLLRRRQNSRNAKLLDQLLSHRMDRNGKMGKICELGYDSKDFLLENIHAPESADDVLARRYYANLALKSVQRGLAIQEWSYFQEHHQSVENLGRALAAFDMFVLHEEDADMDIDHIEGVLDAFAASFLSAHPSFEHMTTREKALKLNVWIRSKDLTGIDQPDLNYRNIRNCFIGQALTDENHPSLPIISSAIYCSLANRVGLSAACCAFPSHVHAIVISPAGVDLDGLPSSGEEISMSEKMFLDPYARDGEITISELRARLASMGPSVNGASDAFMRPSPTSSIVQRTAHNLQASYARAIVQQQGLGPTPLSDLRSGDATSNLNAAFYASMWAALLMTPTNLAQWGEYLDAFANRYVQNFLEDAWIIDKYLMPLVDRFMRYRPIGHPMHMNWQDAEGRLGAGRDIDSRPPTVQRRYTTEIQQRVRFRVGQVFRHKRYNYIGIINGWAAHDFKDLPTPHQCQADETAVCGDEEDADHNRPGPAAPSGSLSRASRIPPGRSRQTFYTCLRTGVDRHVVAQENIVVLTDPTPIPEHLIFHAGKFFKRFDREKCEFVSNIREFFPDD